VEVSRPSVSKAVKAIQALGLSVVEVVVAPDGTVRVLTAPANMNADDELEAARERRRARKVDRAA